MADEKPSLHIDSDWKKQAQEEKKRLAEEEAKRAAAAPPAAAPAPPDQSSSRATAAPSVPPASGRAAGRSPREAGEMPPATFATLVQSLVTQALYYLGDLSVRGAQPSVNLDMSKHNIDLLTILEQKTANNLTPDEKRLLDTALYEARMRYVSVASQLLGP